MFRAIWRLAPTHHSNVCCATKSFLSARFISNGSGSACAISGLGGRGGGRGRGRGRGSWRGRGRTCSGGTGVAESTSADVAAGSGVGLEPAGMQAPSARPARSASVISRCVGSVAWVAMVVVRRSIARSPGSRRVARPTRPVRRTNARPVRNVPPSPWANPVELRRHLNVPVSHHRYGAEGAHRESAGVDPSEAIRRTQDSWRD